MPTPTIFENLCRDFSNNLSYNYSVYLSRNLSRVFFFSGLPLEISAGTHKQIRALIPPRGSAGILSEIYTDVPTRTPLEIPPGVFPCISKKSQYLFS